MASAANDPPPPDLGQASPPSAMEGASANSSGGAGGGGSARIKVLPDPDRDRICATLPQTDLGNAERFRVRFGHLFRFCPDIGWLRWDGRRWALLTQERDELPGEVMQAVFLTVRAIANEAKLVAASGDIAGVPAEVAADEGRMDFVVKMKGNVPTMFSDTIREHAKASESKSRLSAIPALVQSFDTTLVRQSDLDREEMAINVLNGTIRVFQESGRWRVRRDDHDPADLITKVANVIFDPKALCPEYDRFFERIMPDADDRRFLHQWGGLSSTGNTDYHKMVFAYGKGRNGKSTWTEQVAFILGEYAQTIEFDSFLEQASKRKGGDATPDLACLPGVRFLRTSEPEKGAKLAEALIKKMTGGESMRVRHLNKGFFEFEPTHKVFAQGNYRPKITGHDDGIWARVRLVPFTVRIPDGEIDITLPAKLREEASGVFNHMLRGLIDLLTNGLAESSNILAATEKYRDQSDQLGRFLHDCTVDRPGGRVEDRMRSSVLFDLFKAWVAATGGGEWQPQGFAKAMEDRGYERVTSNGVWWQDIAATVTKEEIEAGRFGEAPTGDGGDDAAPDEPAPPRPFADDDDYNPFDQ